ALRDAYAGLLPQLQAAKRFDEMKLYQSRLQILEPAARAPAPRAPIHRGVSAAEHSDPFDASNAAPAKPKNGPSFREQADQAFERRQYERAGELFTRAQRDAPQSVANCGE